MASPAASSSIELELGRIRELSKSLRHGEALASAEALAVRAPENRDVLYLIGANQRCLNRIPNALESLQRLENTIHNSVSCTRSAVIATRPCGMRRAQSMPSSGHPQPGAGNELDHA